MTPTSYPFSLSLSLASTKPLTFEALCVTSEPWRQRAVKTLHPVGYLARLIAHSWTWADVRGGVGGVGLGGGVGWVAGWRRRSTRRRRPIGWWSA